MPHLCSTGPSLQALACINLYLFLFKQDLYYLDCLIIRSGVILFRLGTQHDSKRFMQKILRRAPKSTFVSVQRELEVGLAGRKPQMFLHSDWLRDTVHE